MAELHAIGIDTLKIGAIGTTGGMGGTLVALPNTVKGSCKFMTAEQGVTSFFADNKPRPIEAIANGGVLETIEGTLYDITPATLVTFLGGTATAAVGPTPGPAAAAFYEAGTTIPQVEKSLEIVTKNGVKVEMVRVLITSSIDWGLGDEGIFNLKFKGTILEPTDGTSKAYKITMKL